MSIRRLFQHGRNRTPTRDDLVASIPVYVRRAVLIFFLLPAALPMGVIAVAGHFSFKGTAQEVLSMTSYAGTDPGVIRVRDCPPTSKAVSIEHQCDNAPLKDVPIEIAAERGGDQLKVFYEMSVLIAIALFFTFGASSPFDARGRFSEWVSRRIDELKQ